MQGLLFGCWQCMMWFLIICDIDEDMGFRYFGIGEGMELNHIGICYGFIALLAKVRMGVIALLE